MKRIGAFLCLLAVLTPLLVPQAAYAANPKKTAVLGVLAYRTKADTAAHWQFFIDYLNEKQSDF